MESYEQQYIKKVVKLTAVFFITSQFKDHKGGGSLNKQMYGRRCVVRICLIMSVLEKINIDRQS